MAFFVRASLVPPLPVTRWCLCTHTADLCLFSFSPTLFFADGYPLFLKEERFFTSTQPLSFHFPPPLVVVFDLLDVETLLNQVTPYTSPLLGLHCLDALDSWRRLAWYPPVFHFLFFYVCVPPPMSSSPMVGTPGFFFAASEGPPLSFAHQAPLLPFPIAGTFYLLTFNSFLRRGFFSHHQATPQLHPAPQQSPLPFFVFNPSPVRFSDDVGLREIPAFFFFPVPTPKQLSSFGENLYLSKCMLHLLKYAPSPPPQDFFFLSRPPDLAYPWDLCPSLPCFQPKALPPPPKDFLLPAHLFRNIPRFVVLVFLLTFSFFSNLAPFSPPPVLAILSVPLPLP